MFQRVVLVLLALAVPALSQDVDGRVLEDSSGEPLANAELRFHKSGMRELAADLETERDGRFHASGLPAGEYTVSENDAHLLTIRGEKGSILILGTPGTEAEEDKYALSFQHTDKGYALTAVHSAGKAASLVPAARAER